MGREGQRPVANEYGAEEHPAFGVVNVNRATVSPPGASLFDSEILHQRVITLTISRADRKRELNRDWIHRQRSLVEVHMSEAQWAALVSSFGDGSGVPVTIRQTESEYLVPSVPFEPRMQQSMDEVSNAATKAIEAIREARDTYEAKKTAANLRALHFAIENAPNNMTFAAQSLTEHAENVVTKAKADIEAMVTAHAERIGLDPSTALLALNPAGEEESDVAH